MAGADFAVALNQADDGTLLRDALRLVSVLGLAADALQAPLLPRIRFGPDAWAILALAPLGAVALAALAARRTVMRDLRRYV